MLGSSISLVSSLSTRRRKSEQTLFREDLRERVAVLEEKLEQAYKEKNDVADKLSQVLQELAEYKVRLEFLEKENDRLRG